MKPCTVDSVLLAALEEFEYQAISIGCYLLHWRNMKTQAQHKRKMLPSTQSKHCMCTVVNDYCALQVGCQKETDSVYLWLIKVL